MCKYGCVMCDSTCGESLGVFVYPGAQGVSGVCFVLKDDWSWSSFISLLLSCVWGPPDGLQTPWAQLEFSQECDLSSRAHGTPVSKNFYTSCGCTVYLLIFLSCCHPKWKKKPHSWTGTVILFIYLNHFFQFSRSPLAHLELGPTCDRLLK